MKRSFLFAESVRIAVGFLVLIQISSTVCAPVENLELRFTNETFSIDAIYAKTSGKPNLVQTFFFTDTDYNLIPVNLFSILPNVTNVTISRNELKVLPDIIFQYVPHLIKVDLGQNKIEALPETVFRDQVKLEEIYLNGNNLTGLSVNNFEGLVSLWKLDLSKNWLRTLPDGIFRDLHKLSHLHLNGNQLSTLPSNLFQSQIALVELHLNENHLRTLPRNIFSVQESACKVNISDNQWLCDAEFQEAIHSLNKWTAEKFLCDDGQTMAEKNESTKLCPSQCKCRFMNERTMFAFNCENRKLATVPAELGQKLQQLPEVQQIAVNLDYNNLEHVPNSSMPGFERITNITARNNSIKSIDVNNLPLNLMEIDLSGNQLESLSPEAIQHLSSLKSLEKLVLAGNVWICDDSFFDFVRFNVDKIDYYENIACKDGEQLFWKHDRLAFWITNKTENATKPEWSKENAVIRKIKHEDDLGRICPTVCECLVKHRNTTAVYQCLNNTMFRTISSHFKAGSMHWPFLIDPDSRRIIN